MSAHPVRRIRVIVNGVEHTYRTSYFERPNHVYAYKVPAGGPGDQIMLEVETGELEADALYNPPPAESAIERLAALEWEPINRATRIIESALSDDCPLTQPMLTDLLIDNWREDWPPLRTASEARRLVDVVLFERPDLSTRLARQ